VGGDFYDFFFIDDDHFAVIVADVSGKGIPAALFMAITKTIIKNRLQSGEDPALALEIINHQLCDNNIMDMFVTVWLCVLEISSNKLVYVNAGHNQPMIGRGDQGFTFLVSPPDLPLAGMDDTRYHSREMQLENDDVLFLYTDGIVEAADLNGAFYGKERLRSFLNGNAVAPLNDMLPRLRADIAAFTGGAEQSDDITMLAVRIAGGEPSVQALTLKAAVAELDALTAFIDRGLDAASAIGGRCPDRIRGQIELAAEEIFVNIANYAYKGVFAIKTDATPEGGEVTIECRIKPSPGGMRTMTLTFRDRGRAFNPLNYDEPDITLPLEEREPGGLGLLIVKKTMDTIQYSREDGINRLEFSKSWQEERK
jgi:sigma-B regulation protein RsbU (phosphoserine phosphatase)